MEETVVKQHEEDAKSKATEDRADDEKGVEVTERGVVTVVIPQNRENHILSQNYDVVCGHPTTSPTLTNIEPAEDVDDTQHHIVDDLFPAGHAEIRLPLDDPEGHQTPVGHYENAKVEVKLRGEERERQGSGGNGKEMPEDLHHRSLVGHGHLIIAGIPQDLLVRSDHPGKR